MLKKTAELLKCKAPAECKGFYISPDFDTFEIPDNADTESQYTTLILVSKMGVLIKFAHVCQEEKEPQWHYQHTGN